MDTKTIDDKIKLEQTKLSIATSSEEKVSIQKRIKVLKYRRDIERIRSLIKQVEN